VITPEACAAIMWRDAAHKERAAEAMKITAQEVKELGCVDDIIPEPSQGAHSDREAAAELLDSCLLYHLERLNAMTTEQRLQERKTKFRNIAQFYTEV
jgi:acetyl-CoA carboxylase carboxyl transferase subunit alpha